MTFLTKLKILIKYAKYGMELTKILRNETAYFEVPDKVEYLYKSSIPSNITSVYGENVERTDNNLFEDSYIAKVDFPSLIYVSHSCFKNSSIAEVNVPLVKTIGTRSFENASALFSIELPEAKQINDYAFMWSSIETINAPKVELIYPFAFQECYMLMTAYLPSVTDLRSGAFSNDFILTSVTLGALKDTATDNFEYCFSLTDLTVGEGTTASLTLIDADLTQESLHSIIDNYADMNGKEAPTFNVGEYNLSKIEPAYLEKLERKNINYQ